MSNIIFSFNTKTHTTGNAPRLPPCARVLAIQDGVRVPIIVASTVAKHILVPCASHLHLSISTSPYLYVYPSAMVGAGDVDAPQNATRSLRTGYYVAKSEHLSKNKATIKTMYLGLWSSNEKGLNVVAQWYTAY